jgi:hypothetical protein
VKKARLLWIQWSRKSPTSSRTASEQVVNDRSAIGELPLRYAGRDLGLDEGGQGRTRL